MGRLALQFDELLLNIFLCCSDGIPPYAEFSLHQLSVNQPYDVSLHLVIPAYDSNFDLGNFMASLTLATSSNKTLATVRRPVCILAVTFMCLFSHILQAIVLPQRKRYLFPSPSLINLDIFLLASFVPSTSKVNARLELGRRDEWRRIGRGEARELSVVTASLKGTVLYKGVRYVRSLFIYVSLWKSD